MSMAKNRERDMAGYLSLILFAAVGMMVLGGAGRLDGVVRVAGSVFARLDSLIAFQRNRVESREGAFKYFLLGSMASGFLLYGFASHLRSDGSYLLRGISWRMP